MDQEGGVNTWQLYSSFTYHTAKLYAALELDAHVNVCGDSSCSPGAGGMGGAAGANLLGGGGGGGAAFLPAPKNNSVRKIDGPLHCMR